MDIRTSETAGSNKKPEFTRRDFLDLAWKAPIAVTAATLPLVGISRGIEFSISTAPFNENDPEELSPLDFYQLDFVERSSPSPRPPFLDFASGHRNYLRHITLNSELIQKNIAVLYNRMLTEKESNPKFVDLFTEHILMARDALCKQGPGFDRVPDNFQIYQSLALATYSLSAILGAWIKMHEFRDMGVNFSSEYEEVDMHGVSPTYKLWWLLPSVFPLEIDKNINRWSKPDLFLASGKDRAVHLMNHFFIVSRYIGLSLAKNQDAKRIPEFVKLLIFNEKNLAKRSRQISNLAGFGWEVRETFNAEIEGMEAQSGLLDPVANLDFAANKAGAYLACEVFTYLTNNHKKTFDQLLLGLKKIFAQLDSPTFKSPRMVLKLDDSAKFNYYYTEPIE